MAADKHADSHLVQLWVKKATLERWDAFCGEYSLNRTAFIIQACNTYILDTGAKAHPETAGASVKAEINALGEHLTDVITKMQMSTSPPLPVPEGTKERIHSYLEKFPDSEVEEFNSIMGLTKDELLDTLTEMKGESSVVCDKHGRWKNA